MTMVTFHVDVYSNDVEGISKERFRKESMVYSIRIFYKSNRKGTSREETHW